MPHIHVFKETYHSGELAELSNSNVHVREGILRTSLAARESDWIRGEENEHVALVEQKHIFSTDTSSEAYEKFAEEIAKYCKDEDFDLITYDFDVPGFYEPDPNTKDHGLGPEGGRASTLNWEEKYVLEEIMEEKIEEYSGVEVRKG